MMIHVCNHQKESPVSVAQVTRLVKQAAKQLNIDVSGTMSITFIPNARMKALNRRFTGHHRFTDVLSFRYDGEPIIGEILIAPRQAKRYAAAHAVPYRQELARYVVHGLLHWLGHEDRTIAQRRIMRAMENDLLIRCGIFKTAHSTPRPANHDCRGRQHTAHRRPVRQRRSPVSCLLSPVSNGIFCSCRPNR
ncbi:MAG: rRNA maturation RNase YbeY, partial [Candidatus Omnitrophica bacterium]|nr:rRNA maturation RNase YbeY [Candidatus Omnitrophota bacterium]